MINGCTRFCRARKHEQDELESKRDFWWLSGSFIFRHHVQEKPQMYVPQDNSFPIPLKKIDVFRRIHGTLDVLQDCQIDDYWNFDGDRILSGNGLVSPSSLCCIILHLKATRERLTKIHATSWPENSWQMCRVCQRNSSKMKYSIEQTKSRRSTMHEAWEVLIKSIRKTRLRWNLENCAKDVISAHGLCCTVQIARDLRKFILVSKRKIAMNTGKERSFALTTKHLNLSTDVNARLTSECMSAYERLESKIMKITLPKKGSTLWVIIISCANFFLCTRQWRFWMRRPQFTNF